MPGDLSMQASHSLPRALARPSRLLASLATAALLGACAQSTLPVSDMARPQPASAVTRAAQQAALARSEEHTSELQSQSNLVCRLLLEKKKRRRPSPDAYPTACVTTMRRGSQPARRR